MKVFDISRPGRDSKRVATHQKRKEGVPGKPQSDTRRLEKSVGDVRVGVGVGVGMGMGVELGVRGGAGGGVGESTLCWRAPICCRAHHSISQMITLLSA